MPPSGDISFSQPNYHLVYCTMKVISRIFHFGGNMPAKPRRQSSVSELLQQFGSGPDPMKGCEVITEPEDIDSTELAELERQRNRPEKHHAFPETVPGSLDHK
jgi:hypothetical protein